MEERSEQKVEQKKRDEQIKRVWDLRPYLAMGATIVLVGLICIILFFVIFRFGKLVSGLGSVGKILTAIWIGMLLAYILNPVMGFFERHVQKLMRRRGRSEEKVKKVSRVVGIAIAELIFIGILATLLGMIIPQLIVSIEQIATTLPDQITEAMDQIEKFSKRDTTQAAVVREIITNGSTYVDEWIQDNVLSRMQDMVAYVTSGVVSVVKGFFNFIVGIIVSIYILMKKETFICQVKKLVYAIFRPKHGNYVLEVLRKSDDIFGGYFVGEIIDALIVGLLCFAVLYIGNFPYAMLVSVIVGVTNIIPFFGPFLGAIPGAILIFLDKPLYALYFLIIILVIQQLDGNVIKPKVLGETMGLSPFWVIFSILLFGGLFGFLGMLFGAPVFSVIYYLVKRIAEHFLRKRRLPVETADYMDFKNVDSESGEAVFYDEDRQTRHLRKSIESGGFLKRLMKNRMEKSDRDKVEKE